MLTLGILRFHQIHCLSILRKALQLARNGEEIGNAETYCLDFLYQVLELSPDSKLLFEKLTMVDLIDSALLRG